MAVIRYKKLMDYRTRTFAGKWTETKCEDIWRSIQSHADFYNITDIVVKIPKASHQSENLDKLLKGIKRLAQDRKIRMLECTLPDIKRLYATGGNSSKRMLVAALIEKYPELEVKWHNGKRAHAYNAKLFEAIAAAELALRAGH